jgi:hypothetical protein
MTYVMEIIGALALGTGLVCLLIALFNPEVRSLWLWRAVITVAAFIMSFMFWWASK